MGDGTIANRKWFGKIDADGLPAALFVDGKTFARCTKCKIYRDSKDTLLLASQRKRICKLCQSKATATRQYEKTGRVKKRPRVILQKCNCCGHFAKSTNWNYTNQCCKDCGRELKRKSQETPKCKQCGCNTKNKRYTYCSVKCMTDAKKRRHIVQCVQCRMDMEIQESRKKARSYFLCSKECTVVFNAKRSDATKQKRQQQLEEKFREKNEKQNQARLQDVGGWLTKCRNARSVFGYNESTAWYRKCASATQAMKKRCTRQTQRIAPQVDWNYRVRECRKSLYASALRGLLTDWQRKASNASCMLKQKGRFKNAIN